MASTEMTIDEASPIADKNNREIVVCNVNLDLFKNPNWNKGTQSVHERTKTHPCEARCHAYHVLFGYAGINVSIWMRFTERIEQGVPVIASQQHNPWIGIRDTYKPVGKCLPHRASSNAVVAAR